MSQSGGATDMFVKSTAILVRIAPDDDRPSRAVVKGFIGNDFKSINVSKGVDMLIAHEPDLTAPLNEEATDMLNDDYENATNLVYGNAILIEENINENN